MTAPPVIIITNQPGQKWSTDSLIFIRRVVHLDVSFLLKCSVCLSLSRLLYLGSSYYRWMKSDQLWRWSGFSWIRYLLKMTSCVLGFLWSAFSLRPRGFSTNTTCSVPQSLTCTERCCDVFTSVIKQLANRACKKKIERLKFELSPRSYTDRFIHVVKVKLLTQYMVSCD